MKRILEYFAAHPTAANLLMGAFLLMGLLAAPKLLRETFPRFTPTQVQVSVAYPGATAQDAEEAICERVEEALESIADVAEVTCEAREGQATIVAEMVEGGNMDRFLNDVKTEVEAINDFPEKVEDPIISQLNRMDFVMSVAVYGPMSPTDLKAYCEQLKKRLMTATEITQITIAGFSDHQIRIEVPARALMQYGLSVADIASTIASQSVDLPGGTLQTESGDLLIRFMDQRRTIAEFEDLIVVAGSSGAEVRLGDIASITDRFEVDEDKVIFNGQRAGILQINKTENQDALRLVEQAQTVLERERQEAPPGTGIVITRNVSDIVGDRLNMLLENGMQGLVLVFLTMWLFFSFRYAFWVAMGLPVSFLAALYGMQITGMTVNMMTMVGLLLATGLIMDDAIVIAENIAAHIRRGKRPFEAVVDGTAEVAAGVIASFATTVVIFGTLAVFMEGNIGKVLWVMPFVLILALAVSLVEAFLILPHHLAHSLEGMRAERQSRFRQAFDRRFEAFREQVLGRLVDTAVTWRYLFVGAVIALFIVSVGMLAGGRLKFKVFPALEGDQIEARVLLPQGTPLARTEAVAEQLVAAMRELDAEYTPAQPQGLPLVKNIAVYYNKNSDANETGPHVVTVSVDLLASDLRTMRLDELTAKWRERTGTVPDVISMVWKEPVLGPGGMALSFRLIGEDLEQLKAASLDLQHWLSQYTGVVDLQDDLRPGKPELRATLKSGATALGMDAKTISSQLRAAFFGTTATELQYRGESYEVDVRLAPEDKNSLADLDYFHITDKSGNQIPLGNVANLEHGRGWARIARTNGLRTVTVEGDVDSAVANANQIRSDTTRHFMPQLLEKYPGVRTSLQGEAKEGAKTGGSMQTAFLVGIVGVFILLSFQFSSYAEPICVLTAIPMALVGVIWGHLLMGLDLTIPSVMGFISLAGIVVNDSILLVEFLKMRMTEGMEPLRAAPAASRNRLRAVLLTSLTTIAGLAPLLAETSVQAQLLIPLACSIIFGLAMSTVMVLLLVPALYCILDDCGLTVRSRERRRQQRLDAQQAI
ncbi:efflux RND transporter permease subunit [Desulfovibrio psychrotolerans]|uniref:Acriflavin resistance protein n=1 Tax=Desulfovibrio psychrotolerans TaxID=415242 RepID=A0A7J0BSN8_9BACT|nr:efflux RND transporter permease subunit [Desulfovibrio psychrotolerans]GFM36717.1 acriflavin resistance protein [Desulfovibrio psychrotolerans]